MRETADIVVIGGGTTGCSVAFHLGARRLDVVLVERDTIASGPTGRSPAIVRQHYAHPVVAGLARDSLRSFQHWDDAVGGDCGFVQTGFLIGASGSNADALTRNVAAQQAIGIRVRTVSAAEMQDLQPDIVTADLTLGAFEPEAGYCDPYRTAMSLAAAAQRRGVVIARRRAVTAIRVAHGRVQGVDTSQGPIDAPVVVNAAGPWAATVAATIGPPLPIEVSRHCVAVLSPTSAATLPPLMAYADYANLFYLRPETGGLCLVGSLDPDDDRDVVAPDDCKPDVDLETLGEYGGRAARRFSRIEQSEVRGGWASMFDVTPDGYPLIGADPAALGSFVAAGLSGHGFKLCPILGRGIADLVTSGRTELPLELFAVDRFAKGRPVRAEYPYVPSARRGP